MCLIDLFVSPIFNIPQCFNLRIMDYRYPKDNRSFITHIEDYNFGILWFPGLAQLYIKYYNGKKIEFTEFVNGDFQLAFSRASALK